MLESSEDSVHMLIALDRKKDNPNNTGKIALKQIIHNYEDDLHILVARCNGFPGKTFRIYRTVNQRSLSKAFKLFQHHLIDDPNPLKLESIWKSCLMSPKAKADHNFLIDVDSKTHEPYKRLIELGVTILESVSTPRGFHYITKPFDIRCFVFDDVEIKKDSMIYVRTYES